MRSKNRLLDRIITDIDVCAAFDPAKPPSTLPGKLPTKALWDTGASKSVISEEIVEQLALAPVGTRQVHHGDGTSIRNTYLVNFYLPNRVCVAGILATDFPARDPSFAVLVGMDVITLGDFSITNVDNRTCMSFRTPSSQCIDYVQEFNHLRYAGTPRNAPCPCGSGQKYKRCHGQ